MKKLILLAMMFWGVAYGQSKLYLRGDSIQMQSGTNAELILLNGTRSVTNGLLQNIGNGRTRFVSLDSITTAPLASNGATLSGDTVQLGGLLIKNTTIEARSRGLTMTFDSLGTGTGLSLTSASILNPGVVNVTGPQKLFNISLSGDVTGNNRHSYAAWIENYHTNTAAQAQFHYGLGIRVKQSSSNGGAFGIEVIDTITGAAGGSWAGRFISRAVGTSTAIGGGIYIEQAGGHQTLPSLQIVNTGVGGPSNTDSRGIFVSVSGANSGGVSNAAINASATNAVKNYAVIASDGVSSFVTDGDSAYYAHVNIGGSTTTFAALHLEGGTAPASPVNGDIWHANDSLYGHFDGNTFNLLTGAGGSGSQTWQEALDVSSTLDKANTINQDGFLIQWNGPNQFNDTTATQISQRSFNSGVDYLIYTPIAQDTVINLQLNVVDGFRVDVEDGTVSSYFQVKADGTYGESKLYELTTANTNSSGKLVLAPAGTNPTYYMYAETHASTPTTVGMIGVENSNIFYSVFDGDSTLIEMRAPYVMRFKGPGYMFQDMNPPTTDTVGWYPVAMDATGLIKKVAWTYVEPIQTTGFAYSTEFLNNSLSANVNDAVLVPTLSGAGAFVGAGTGTTNHPGIVQIQAGTTTTGRLALAATPTGLEFGAGTFSLETMVRIDDLSDGTETFGFLAGFMDAATSLNQADGVYFLYDSAGTSSGSFSSDKWQLVTVGGGTRTFVESSVVVAADTWYKLRIEVNVNASLVEYFINDVSMGTINTNIPTGSGEVTGFGAGVFKSAGTTNRIVELDYYKVNSTFDVVR